MTHAAQGAPDASPRILKMTDLNRIYRLPRSTVYDWLRLGRFPEPIKLGPRRIGWLASDVEAWLHGRRAA